MASGKGHFLCITNGVPLTSRLTTSKLEVKGPPPVADTITGIVPNSSGNYSTPLLNRPQNSIKGHIFPFLYRIIRVKRKVVRVLN